MVRTDASIQTLEKFFGSTTTKNNPTTIKDDNNIILDKLSAKKIVIDTAEPINTSTSTVQQNAEPNNVNAAFISKVTRYYFYYLYRVRVLMGCYRNIIDVVFIKRRFIRTLIFKVADTYYG